MIDSQAVALAKDFLKDRGYDIPEQTLKDCFLLSELGSTINRILVDKDEIS